MDLKLTTDQINNPMIKKFGKEKIQAFQDSFADLFNISLCLVSLEGKALTVWSNSSLFCHYMLNHNRERCLQERLKSKNQVLCKNQTGIFSCYMGLTFFYVPIFIGGNLIGLFYGGGFYLEENKLPPNKLIANVPIINERKVIDIIQFLENLIKLLNFNENTGERKQKTDKFKEFTLLQKKLSLREIEVVQLINDGFTNKEIADQLHISDRTVKTHVSNILRKLEMRNRMQIVVFCQQNNIV